ncbi:MAG: AAA family ATPase [Candidatus Accumulibacter propinquus]|jgi:predicted ATPase
MIEKIKIKNFKSLGEVTLNLAKFNCLIGMNGSGKSSVLQVIDFISQQMTGNVRGWLGSRGWVARDLNCKLRKESNVVLAVEFRLSNSELLTWGASFNRTSLKCTSESITLGDRRVFHSTGSSFATQNRIRRSVSFTYEGSLLSRLKESELPDSLREFRDFLRNIRSLELLSPHLLRKRARTENSDIGVGGEKLSAFLDSFRGDTRSQLVSLLKTFYPRVADFKITRVQGGGKKLTVIEDFNGQKLETEATHLSDGLLRMLAVLTQTGTGHSLVLLDEIENGVNQEIVEKLVDTLVASSQQMVVTTHSPLILNFLGDDVAKQSVHFIYKTHEGETRIRPFFDIPQVGEKLRYMAPGDAFVDTDLQALTDECVELDRRGDSVADREARSTE